MRVNTVERGWTRANEGELCWTTVKDDAQWTVNGDDDDDDEEDDDDDDDDGDGDGDGDGDDDGDDDDGGGGDNSWNTPAQPNKFRPAGGAIFVPQKEKWSLSSQGPCGLFYSRCWFAKYHLDSGPGNQRRCAGDT